VVACGVRKVWKKEFADLDTPSGQMKRLKEILQDLGMSGRPSLDKAKSIRAQRELAQELSGYFELLESNALIVTSCILEDVQEFAEASRRREVRKENGASGDESSESGTDDDDDGPRVPKKVRDWLPLFLSSVFTIYLRELRVRASWRFCKTRVTKNKIIC